MKRIKNTKLIYALVAVAIIGGISGPLIKYALEDITPLGFSFVRLAGSALILFIALLLLKRRPRLKHFLIFAPVATLWWLNVNIFSAGLEHTTATTAQFIHISIPILTALVAFFVIREKLNKRQWLGSLVALSGVGFVVLSSGALEFSNTTLLGNLLIAVSAITFSVYAVLSRREAFRAVHPVEMIFIASVCGAIVNLPFAIADYQHTPWLESASVLSLVAMAGSIVAITLYYIGFQFLIRKFGPSVATTNLYLLPVSVMIWAFIILREIASFPLIIGAVIALLGVTIFSLATPRNDNV